MKFDLFCLMPQRDTGIALDRVYGDTLELIRLAEDVGLHTAWFAEHHFSNYSLCPSPLMMATHCAAHTSRIRLGTAVLVLPLYHPVRMLEEIGMVDVLSGGRLTIGIGSGYQDYEFARFGVRLEDNWEMTHEILDILEMGLVEGRLRYDGKHFQLPETPIAVRPVQRPMPPIFVTGNDPAIIQRSARQGYVPFFTVGFRGLDALLAVKNHIAKSCEAVAINPDTVPLAYQRYIYVTDDKADALDAAEHALYTTRLALSLKGKYQKLVGTELVPVPFDDEPTLEQIVDSVIIGDPAACVEKLAREIRALRPSYLSCFMHFGGMSAGRAMKSLERFGSEVLPGLERQLGDLDTLGALEVDQVAE